ncbi:SMP-30/gluconolactonase/LRE family protein [Aeoliella sp. SH292]|uniref:SMP-30/gluconolactonase/LRE family protein n=1 Tax=Aeoliella sp. SH292 TaxID=3454464 RepID=UPI003F9728B9
MTTPATVRPLYPAHATLGEGPVWDEREQVLWWVNIEPGELNRFDPSTGENEIFAIGQRVGCLALCQSDSRLLLGMENGVGLFDPATSELTTVCDPEPDQPRRRFNDGKCDAAGRFWGGTMDMDRKPDSSTFYSIDAEYNVRTQLTEKGLSNGLAWSRDNRTMYWIDTRTNCVFQFDFDLQAGTIANQQVAFRVPDDMGRPDGMTIDIDDNLWVCLYMGSAVLHVDPREQKLLHRYELPVTNITCCTFGGQDLSTLYITTARQKLDDEELKKQPQAGDLFVLETDTKGKVANRFGA